MTIDLEPEAQALDTPPRICKREDCNTPLGPDAHKLQQYWFEHQPQKGGKRDTPPRVTVNVNNKAPRATKADTDAAKVREGAERMLGLLPIAFFAVGDTQCGLALQAQIPAIAKQLGELAEFHPGLKKIFAPTESTGEAMAWLGLAIAVAPVIMAILVHHNLVSEKLATTLAGVTAMVPNNGG